MPGRLGTIIVELLDGLPDHRDMVDQQTRGHLDESEPEEGLS
jgi:hypothetical protein